MLEQLYATKERILKKSLEIFSNSNSAVLKIGCELEFFLLDENLKSLVNKELVAGLISELKEKLKKEFFLIYEVEKEHGVSQVEIKTDFTADLSRLAGEIENAKKFIKDFAQNKNLIASFTAQPFADDCGSALQFNISLHENEQNLLLTDKKLINKIAAQLLENTDFMMVVMAPKKDDYRRFSYLVNQNLFRLGKFTAPINLSFGGNNRTCAIRVVSDTPNSKRLEYRIAAADADPFLSMSLILLTLSNSNLDLEELPQLFGNAFDAQYNIKNFCQNLSEAQEQFLSEENLIRKKLFSLL
jgi:glutamine synthetase